MTVTIVIPLFEAFQSIPADLQVALICGLFGVAMIASSIYIHGMVRVLNPLFIFGLFFLGVTFLSLLHFMAMDVLSYTPPNWVNATRFELPVRIEVK